MTTPFPRPFPETHERVEVPTPDTVCARREGGTTCLRLTDIVPLPLPAASYVELAGGYRTACGILPDGSAACWQWEQDGSAFTAFERSTYPDGPLHGLTVGLNSILNSGESVACAHRDDETPVCWVYDP